MPEKLKIQASGNVGLNLRQPDVEMKLTVQGDIGLAEAAPNALLHLTTVAESKVINTVALAAGGIEITVEDEK